MGMTLPPARVDRRIAAGTEKVWDLLTDLDQWPQWGPSVRRAELRDGGTVLTAGARGTVWTTAGVALPFTVTDFVPGRRWDWSVAGVAATGHEVAAIPGGCRVRFTVPRWAYFYLPVCSIALARIERLVGQRQ